MCHESCTDNGSIIESAAGWATKLQIVRGQGCVLRKSLTEDVSPENVRDVWDKVTDMSKKHRFESNAEASMALMKVLEDLDNKSTGNTEPQEAIDTFTFGSKDLILYALGSELQCLIHFYIKFYTSLIFSWSNHHRYSKSKILI